MRILAILNSDLVYQVRTKHLGDFESLGDNIAALKTKVHISVFIILQESGLKFLLRSFPSLLG